MIKIGLVYEGHNDEDIIIRLISKIINNKWSQVQFEIVEKIPSRTGIIGYVGPYSKHLFEKINVDIAIFLTDQDVSIEKDNRRKHILRIIEKVLPGYKDFSAVGVANPHLEQWLMADKNLIKRIFCLPNTSPIPHPELELHPKNRLKALWAEMSNPRATLHETLVKIADEITIESIKEVCPDFKIFARDLVNSFKQIER